MPLPRPREGGQGQGDEANRLNLPEIVRRPTPHPRRPSLPHARPESVGADGEDEEVGEGGRPVVGAADGAEAFRAARGRGRRGMSRQELRDVARLQIGDTGLLDFVLKSLGGCVVGAHLVRRCLNPATHVLEFSLQEAPAGLREEVERDVWYVYGQVFDEYPPGKMVVVRDCRHFFKTWPFGDRSDDGNLRPGICARCGSTHGAPATPTPSPRPRPIGVSPAASCLTLAGAASPRPRAPPPPVFASPMKPTTSPVPSTSDPSPSLDLGGIIASR